MKIKKLTQQLINQIAAGEIIERPASVVKELVENALDAGASKIKISLRGGGQSSILVEDDGEGIAAEELELAVCRHTTSKLAHEDLFLVDTFGFRGEALASIGSISKMTIVSKTANDKLANEITVENSACSSITAAVMPNNGTKIEVRDLFFSTPVRLKFLKSHTTEIAHVEDVVKKLALANPHCAFHLLVEGKISLQYDVAAMQQRFADVLGKDFMQNSLDVAENRDGYAINGLIGLPVFHTSASALKQFFFVQKRAVKDKLISGCINAIYRDLVPHGRYPSCLLFLTLPYKAVDINAHPAKVEVRFREPNIVRALLASVVKHATSTHGPVTTSTLTDKTCNAFTGDYKSSDCEGSDYKGIIGYQGVDDQNVDHPSIDYKSDKHKKEQQGIDNFQQHTVDDSLSYIHNYYHPHNLDPHNLHPQDQQPYNLQHHNTNHSHDQQHSNTAYSLKGEKFNLQEDCSNQLTKIDRCDTEHHLDHHLSPAQITELTLHDEKLGMAIGQLHNSYIVAQNREGLVLIDQHAAHERINYENMKKALLNQEYAIKTLLVPKIVRLEKQKIDCIIANSTNNILQKKFILERFDSSSVLIRGIPAFLDEKIDIQQLLDEIADFLLCDDFPQQDPSEAILHAYAAGKTCKNSRKAGNKLSINEMNNILRLMEQTENSSQCNHGRPTMIFLSIERIAKLFSRS